MKKYKLTIVVETSEEVQFTLFDHDVIDGFELTRDGDNLGDEFKLKYAYIEKVEKLEK
jgi:hypothetical protein